MKPKWLLSNLGSEDVEPLRQAIKNQDLELVFVENHLNNSFLDYFNEDDCVIYFGPLLLGSLIKHRAKWVPGVYYNIPQYKCTYYYPRLSQFLLNSDYIMMPYGELVRRKDFIYETLGVQDTVFIRPDSGSKSFTGTVFYKEEFENRLDKLCYGQLEPEELVVIATPQNLDGEWRLICVDGKIITGSQYKNKLGLKVKSYVPQEVWEYGQQVADASFNPDRAYCIDIGYREHYNDYKLIEIGCFSCAGLYASNRDIIVEEVSRIALEEWQEYHEI